MAEIVSFYNLCNVEDAKDILGLSRDRDDGNIIATFGRNIIIIIKLSTQKQIQSWTVLDKLSNKVVYDPKSQYYVGVFSDQFIRCWTAGETDINTKKKVKFQKPILDLISFEMDEIVVLYTDGSCEYLSDAIESRKLQSPNNRNEKHVYSEIFDPKIIISHNRKRIITYFTKTHGKISLITIPIGKGIAKKLSDVKVFKLYRHDENIALIGQAVVESHEYPFLLSLWSDGRMFGLRISSDSNESDSPGNLISMINLLNVDQPISILGISKNCIAFYGSNNIHDGSSLLLYNTQFRVVSSKQFFKVYFNYSRLWIIGNHIVLALGQNLYVVYFTLSKKLLSEIIGSQISNESHNVIGKEFIKEEDELEDVLHFDYKKNFNHSGGGLFINCNDFKADGKLKPYQPMERFNEYLNGIVGWKKNCDVTFDSMNEYKVDIKECKFSIFDFGELDVIAHQLEECGASEQEITEKLLMIGLNAPLSDILYTVPYFRKYSNISEIVLSRLLKYKIMQLPSGAFAKENFEELTTHIHTLIFLINTIFSCSLNEDTSAPIIRKVLDFKEAMLCFEFLLYNISSKDFFYEVLPTMPLHFNDDLKIMQWLGILLNVYLQDFTFSKNSIFVDILKKWKEFLVSYKHDLCGVLSLYPIIKNVADGQITNDQKVHCKWYGIEEVQLF